MKGIYEMLGRVVLGVSLWLVLSGSALALDAGQWVAALGGFNQAMNAGNVKMLASGFAPDGVRIHPVAGEVTGPVGNEKFLQGLHDRFKDQNLIVHRYTASGNTIVVEWTWEAVDRTSGKPVTLPELVIFDLTADGHIQKMRQYFDTAAFVKQLQ